jgi:hypothetical protein
MLTAGFVGCDNLYDRYICHWLAERTDLRLIVWTDELRWSAPSRRWKNIATRYCARERRFGRVRVLDEIAYYLLYAFSRHRDSRRIGAMLRALEPRTEDEVWLAGIRQLRAGQIGWSAVLEAVKEEQIGVLFATCIDVLLPEEIISTPTWGSYLWHEGITPEYRGVYPAFWALANRDYDRLGYTLLRMNMRLDSGNAFVQGNVRDVDPRRDSHVYIGHKAVLDSLPETERFLQRLEQGEAAPLKRGPRVDCIYSYPTASALARILWYRWHLRRAGSCGLAGRESAGTGGGGQGSCQPHSGQLPRGS